MKKFCAIHFFIDVKTKSKSMTISVVDISCNNINYSTTLLGIQKRDCIIVWPNQTQDVVYDF